MLNGKKTVADAKNIKSSHELSNRPFTIQVNRSSKRHLANMFPERLPLDLRHLFLKCSRLPTTVRARKGPCAPR